MRNLQNAGLSFTTKHWRDILSPPLVPVPSVLPSLQLFQIYNADATKVLFTWPETLECPNDRNNEVYENFNTHIRYSPEVFAKLILSESRSVPQDLQLSVHFRKRRHETLGSNIY